MNTSHEFIESVKQQFSFLINLGYQIEPAIHFRDETNLYFKSRHLLVYFFHTSFYGNYYCAIGQTSEHYRTQLVPVSELFDEIDVTFSYANSVQDSLCELSSLMELHLNKLLTGNLELLENIQLKKKQESDALKRYQRKIAIIRELVGSAEILEIPNTKEALGVDYIGRFPGHEFNSKTTWLVYISLGACNCKSYEQAKKFADEFGGE